MVLDLFDMAVIKQSLDLHFLTATMFYLIVLRVKNVFAVLILSTSAERVSGDSDGHEGGIRQCQGKW